MRVFHLTAFFKRTSLAIFLGILLSANFSFAQTLLNEQPKKRAFLSRLKTKHGLIVPVPLVTYSPETSLGLGFSGQYIFRFAKDSASNLSIAGATFLYTLEKQIILNPNWDFYFRQSKWRINGVFVYQKFPEKFWGVGNDTKDEDRESFTAKYIVFRNRVTRQVVKNLHLGLQYRIEYAFDMEKDSTGLLATEPIPGTDGYVASGAGLAAIYDTRDNSMFPFRGWFVVFSNHFYPGWLGSNHQFANFKLDARRYFNPFTSNVIAVQALLSFHAGDPPFKMQALLGGIETMRGYYMGRYRDKHLMAAQVEWRFPIWWRFIGVGFYGIGDVTNDFQDVSLKRLKHSIGGGIRFTLDPKERINVRFDAAFGFEGSRGFYFQIGEAF